MPVELHKMPEKVSLPEPPDKIRWLIIIVVVFLAGAAISLYFWPKDVTTHSAWFWFCTLVIPLFVGIASYALCLRSYENECDRIHWWNHLHQKQYDTQVNRGQRYAALLGKAYITSVANNKLASVLLGAGSQLQSQYSPFLQRSLMTAQLKPYPLTFSESEYVSRLEIYLSQLIRMLQPDLSAVPGNLSIRIHHDGTLESAQIRMLWEKLYDASNPMAEIAIESGGDGLMWLDDWLDKQERQLSLSVEINLFGEIKDKHAESVSALLLASPEWVSEYGDEHVSAVIHRPAVVDDDNNAFNDALLWGELDAGDKFSVWRSQLKGKRLTTQLQSIDKAGYMPGLQNEHLLDDLFGCPGAATGNILLICASEHAAATNFPQLLMTESKTIHQAIVRPVES